MVLSQNIILMHAGISLKPKKAKKMFQKVIKRRKTPKTKTLRVRRSLKRK